MHGTPASAARIAAREYITEGWRIVPVPRSGESKGPKEPGWPDIEFTEESIGDDDNVGVILGSVSKHLCDVDLDAHWAMPLAPHFLPKTVTFGRASKPASHWLYYCEGLRAQRFTLFRRGESKVELVELRGMNASNDRCGHQSVFPGSVHKSGEAIDWTPDGPQEITHIERGALIWATTKLTVACAIADGWEPGTQRNNKARAWAAGLLEQGWVPSEVYELFDAVFEVAGVERTQRDNDLAGVQRTIDAFERGDKLQGFGTLVSQGLVNDAIVRRVELLSRTPATLEREAKLAQSRMGSEVRERIILEAHSLDTLGGLQDRAAALCETKEAEADSFFGKGLNMVTATKRVEYVCQPLGIAPGKITIIAGYSGTSKGPFMNQLALCVAAGKPFLKKPVAKRKVAYFDFETGSTLLSQRLWRMNNALGNDRTVIAAQMDVFVSARQIDDEWLTKFEESVEPRMVCFIDSYTSAVGGNANESMYADVAWSLGRISEAKNVTIIVAMHARKRQQGTGGSLLESVAGNAALTAASQTAIIISRPREEEPHVIAVKCGRAVEEPFKSFEITWHDFSDPALKPDATPGEKSAAVHWGLLAKRSEDESENKAPAGSPAHERTVVVRAQRTITEIERELLLQMSIEYPGSIQAPVQDLAGGGASSTRNLRKVALRNLIQRGALLANYHWTSTNRAVKRLVWLPGPKAEMGFDQK